MSGKDQIPQNMENSLSPEQKTIVNALKGIKPGKNLLVLAGPGSGKTRTLVPPLQGRPHQQPPFDTGGEGSGEKGCSRSQ